MRAAVIARIAARGGPDLDRRPPALMDALAPRPTGGFIVTMRDAAPGAGMDALARAGAASARCVDCEEMGALDMGAAAEPLLLSDYGVAVIPPRAASPALAAALAADEAVAEARPETFLFALAGPRAAFAPGPAEFEDDPARTWGVAAVGAQISPLTGAGIAIAVLDTGLDAGHPDFAGREIVARDFTGGPVDGARDVQGHGTHCAGTAAGPRARGGLPRYGVAPEAALHVGKVLGDDGAGREGDILAGMAWAIEAGCAAISMSLGAAVAPGQAPSLVYERLGRRALDRGCLILAAAGNDSARGRGVVAPVGSPANAPSILAVGALDPALAPAPFSNGGLDEGTGGAVDLAGPGVDVFSAAPRPRLHRVLSGTSMACPHAAGVAALLAQSDPALRGERLWRALVEGAAPLPHPARDVGSGLAHAAMPGPEPGPEPEPGPVA